MIGQCMLPLKSFKISSLYVPPHNISEKQLSEDWLRPYPTYRSRLPRAVPSQLRTKNRTPKIIQNDC